MKFLLVGNYGVGNLGDELLREYFLKVYSEVEWILVTGDVSKFGIRNSEFGVVPRLPFGPRSLLTTPWWKTLSALRKSDGLVFGGGTLFTDIESLRAPFLWWWHAVWAWIFRKKIILAFQGIGPFRTRAGEWCSRWVVAHAACVIVRDHKSLQRIAGWKNKKCVQSFDPVFSLFQSENHDERTKKVFIIIPRANSTDSFQKSVQELRVKMKGETQEARIVSLEPDDPREQETCRSLAREFQAQIVTPRSLQELEKALWDASFVITQRYHGAIAALGMQIPFVAVPQKPGDKLAAVGHIHRDDALRLLKEGESALRQSLSGMDL